MLSRGAVIFHVFETKGLHGGLAPVPQLALKVTGVGGGGGGEPEGPAGTGVHWDVNPKLAMLKVAVTLFASIAVVPSLLSTELLCAVAVKKLLFPGPALIVPGSGWLLLISDQSKLTPRHA